MNTSSARFSPDTDLPPAALPEAASEAGEYAVFMLDTSGCITGWTPDAERQTGHSGVEIIGRHFRLLLEPEPVADGRAEILLREAQRLGFIVDAGWRVRKDGSRFQAKLIVSAIRDRAGGLIGFSAVQRDLTESIRIHEQLRAQAAMLDQAHDAIILYDLDQRITFWNRGATRLLGWTAGEVVGRTAREVYSPLDLPAIQAAMQETAIRGSWHGELQVHNKAGQPIVLDTHRSLIRDSAGRPAGHLSINLDLTEKKRIESQFLRAQRMESIGILAGGIAHDLNNVLAPILMSIALLKLKIPGNESVQKQLDQLAANAQRGANLVKQVLAFGRGVGSQRVLMQPKHIGREIEQIINDTFPKNIEFDFSFSHELWPVTGDPTQLHQVLLNLCVNARDAMPDGGKLALRLDNVTLDSVYAGMSADARPGPYVLLEVSDTGCGIPPEIRDRIFEPFFTTKDVGKGTGLGLSTTLAIVKSHGGFITVDSQPGKGSRFRVFLPAESSPVAATPESAGAHPHLPRGQNELILIVDDEELILEVARNALERFGYRTLLAKNGTEAVALYAIHRGDVAVVITDMAMPIMDGAATILALRTINPDVKIIGSSGQGTTSAMKAGKAKNLGLEHFIAKPYTAETLLHTLARVLGRDSNPPMPVAPA
ncbi:MAG: PAS domain S-box protein [Verrucomicrobiota bacterium]